MNRLIILSRALPTPDPVRTVGYTPIRLAMPGLAALRESAAAIAAVIVK